MYFAFNRITIKKGSGNDLEERFSLRRGIESMPGFLGFQLTKQIWSHHPATETDEYLVIGKWRSQQDFWFWTKSDEFKKAHAGPRPDYIVDSEPGLFEVRVSREPESSS